MQPKIQQLWSRLENQRVELTHLISQYDNTTLNKKPTPEAWSALQVVAHLMSAEQASLDYMKKKLSFTSKVPKAGLKSWFRRFALSVVFALPFKYKAPALLEKLPEQSDFKELTSKWASQRLELLDFIEKLPDNVINGEIWRHQLAGKMTIAQMLDFFYTHSKRHTVQIKRTINP
jgi:uncharacterized damage-inducible protein DinB